MFSSVKVIEAYACSDEDFMTTDIRFMAKVALLKLDLSISCGICYQLQLAHTDFKQQFVTVLFTYGRLLSFEPLLKVMVSYI